MHKLVFALVMLLGACSANQPNFSKFHTDPPYQWVGDFFLAISDYDSMIGPNREYTAFCYKNNKSAKADEDGLMKPKYYIKTHNDSVLKANLDYLRSRFSYYCDYTSRIKTIQSILLGEQNAQKVIIIESLWFTTIETDVYNYFNGFIILVKKDNKWNIYYNKTLEKVFSNDFCKVKPKDNNIILKLTSKTHKLFNKDYFNLENPVDPAEDFCEFDVPYSYNEGFKFGLTTKYSKNKSGFFCFQDFIFGEPIWAVYCWTPKKSIEVITHNPIYGIYPPKNVNDINKSKARLRWRDWRFEEHTNQFQSTWHLIMNVRDVLNKLKRK